MTKYFETLEALENHRCHKCGGLGKWDDAEPGDISFKTFACKPCEGTGFTHGIVLQLSEDHSE